jgi:tetratricopeptide (TPR) repeat protein
MLLISALILLLLSLDFDLGAYFEGNLWLATAKGVYRYDGSRWTESAGARRSVPPPWLRLPPGSGCWIPTGTAAVGLAGRDVNSVIASPGRLWVGSPGGFDMFDGPEWQNLGAPPHSGGMAAAARAFDGGLFAIAAAPPPGVTARLVLALPLLLLCAAAILLLVYLIYYWRRMRRRESGEPLPVGTGWDPRNEVATRWTRQALNNADYRGAMRKMRRLGAGLPSGYILLLQGIVLSLGGMPEEAERRCRRALRRSSGARTRFALDRLATVLADLGRYEEARPFLEEAVELYDDFDLANADLAELLLLEGFDCERALDLVERAMVVDPSPASYSVGRLIDAEWMALRAWALAGVGRRLDAEICAQRTLDRVAQKSHPAAAGVYWRLGMALERIADDNAAVHHSQNAAMVDAQGKYGILANLQIEQRASWGVST